MATTYKVLGQNAANGSSSANLYTVPSATQTVVSTISICNPNSANANCSLMVVPSGKTLSSNSYVVGGATVQYNDTLLLTIGLTLNTGDTVQCIANTANVSFNLFGSEIA